MIGMFHCECQYLQHAFFGHLKKPSKIDYPVSDDRGLLACLQGVNLHTAEIEEFTRVNKITTLDDFIYLVAASDWEKSLDHLHPLVQD